MEHLEGKQSVIAALTAGERRIDVVLIRHGMHAQKTAEVLELAQKRQVPIRYVDGSQLDAMAHGSSHGGVLAVASAKPRMAVDDLIEAIRRSPSPPLMLLIEGVEDARNLGFVLRTAEAMGCLAVLVKKHLWDLDPVEISRPSSGAYERLPLVQVDSVDPLKRIQREGVRVIGCIAGARRTLQDVRLDRPALLCVGGEKRGLSGAVREICDRFVRIGTVGGPSSLSLSHASAIVLAEARRQRDVAAAGSVLVEDDLTLDDPADTGGGLSTDDPESQSRATDDSQ